jgi:hypothetical protein
MCKFDWCWVCSEPSRETRCTKPVKKDKKERYIAASKNALALEEVIRSGLESLADPISRASVMALEGIVDNCITARSHIITIFADAQVPSHLHVIFQFFGSLCRAGCFWQHERTRAAGAHARHVGRAVHAAAPVLPPASGAGVQPASCNRVIAGAVCIAAFAQLPRCCPRFYHPMVTRAQAATDMLRHLPLKELQVRNTGPVASRFRFLCVVLSVFFAWCCPFSLRGVVRFLCVVLLCFADLAQDIILDTKTELTIEGVQRWLDSTDTQGLKGKYCMEEVE